MANYSILKGANYLLTMPNPMQTKGSNNQGFVWLGVTYHRLTR